MYAPPLKPGQTLDLKTDYGKYWPGQPVLFKLTEDWGFAIPPQYMQFWIQRDRVVRHPAPWSKIPLVESIGFEFFMPDFGGYTPDNYQDEFHEDKVELIEFAFVGMGEEQAGAPGSYPPNMFARVSAKRDRSFHPDEYQDRYGLRCYGYEPQLDIGSTQYCYGLRDSKTNEHILLKISPPPYPEWIIYPHMQAKYFSPRYGGVYVLWRAQMKHFPHWREIDQQIWRFIEQWSIHPSSKLFQPTHPSQQ